MISAMAQLEIEYCVAHFQQKGRRWGAIQCGYLTVYWGQRGEGYWWDESMREHVQRVRKAMEGQKQEFEFTLHTGQKVSVKLTNTPNAQKTKRTK